MYSPLRRRFVLDSGKQMALGVGCSGRIARLMRMKWNKDILAWIRSLICGCLAISSWGFFASRMGHPELAVKPFPFSYSGNSGYKRRLAKRKMVVREANRKQRVKWVVKWCKDSRQLLGKSSVFRWKSDFALYKPSCLHLATRRRKVQPTSYLLSLWTDKFGDLGRCLNSDCWWRQHQLCQVRWHPRRKRTFGQQFSGILKEKNTCSWMTMRLFTEPTL